MAERRTQLLDLLDELQSIARSGDVPAKTRSVLADVEGELRRAIGQLDAEPGDDDTAANEAGPLGAEPGGVPAAQIPPSEVTPTEVSEASDDSLLDRLRDTELTLAAEHPTLTGVVRRLIDVLAQMGI